MCNAYLRNTQDDETTTTGAQKSSKKRIPYFKSNHQALIALCCAANQHLFNMVNDKLYKAEVSMLWLGTHISSPATPSLYS
jgi:hypothetical protein